MERVKVIVELGNDSKYSAYMDCYGYDFGLAGFGSTAKKAIADFYESYREEREMCAKEGKPVPELEFNVRYDIASFLSYYSGILSKPAVEKITGINQKQLWHYMSRIRKPKPETLRKIQASIHSFADNLRQILLISRNHQRKFCINTGILRKKNRNLTNQNHTALCLT